MGNLQDYLPPKTEDLFSEENMFDAETETYNDLRSEIDHLKHRIEVMAKELIEYRTKEYNAEKEIIRRLKTKLYTVLEDMY